MCDGKIDRGRILGISYYTSVLTMWHTFFRWPLQLNHTCQILSTVHGMSILLAFLDPSVSLILYFPRLYRVSRCDKMCETRVFPVKVLTPPRLFYKRKFLKKILLFDTRHAFFKDQVSE